uniref:Glycosyl hydrolase family 32 N-terminal domain-containing protein n=1 Tax=Ananas comosus var. bracteatus TaxID=296719 RepID=A0A6V7P6N8_ANACO|nr:unnamed protein product [Ananas comosus var. bracteatus]
MEAAAAAVAAYRPSTTNTNTRIKTTTTLPLKTVPRRTPSSSILRSPARRVHRSRAADPKSPPSISSPPSDGLVFDAGPTARASWDCHVVGSPVVERYLTDASERWLMWYHGLGPRGGADAVGIAVSNNGVHWERGSGDVASGDDVGRVMGPSTDWWAFDTERVRPSDVLIMSSAKLRTPGAVYWLYYTGFGPEKVAFPNAAPSENGVSKSLPGLAVSQDGRHWARIEGEHHSGALIDVGAPREWDSLSRDGIRWVKLGKVLDGGAAGCFDEGGVRCGHVVRDQKDGKYVMVYEGVCGNGRTSIGLAESVDGLKNWRRCGDGPILSASTEDNGWDNQGIGDPCLIRVEGGDEWRLYYGGSSRSGRTGIGMAVSEGGELGSFSKWKGFNV